MILFQGAVSKVFDVSTSNGNDATKKKEVQNQFG